MNFHKPYLAQYVGPLDSKPAYKTYEVFLILNGQEITLGRFDSDKPAGAVQKCEEAIKAAKNFPLIAREATE